MGSDNPGIQDSLKSWSPQVSGIMDDIERIWNEYYCKGSPQESEELSYLGEIWDAGAQESLELLKQESSVGASGILHREAKKTTGAIKESELSKKEAELSKKESELLEKEAELFKKEAELSKKDRELLTQKQEQEQERSSDFFLCGLLVEAPCLSLIPT